MSKAEERKRHPPRRIAEADPTRWPALAPRPKSEAGLQLRNLCKSAGKLIGDYALIPPGSRVLCALSGGKDSFAMLEVLLRLQSKAAVDFTLGAVVVQPGFPGFEAEAVAAFAAERGLDSWVVDADFLPTMQGLDWRDSPCALCAKLRRGVLYRVATELGYDRLALGHHGDDAIETVLMNMLFNGQLRAMAPLARPQMGEPLVIRPLLSSTEPEIRTYARTRRFRLLDPECPVCELPGDTMRVELKHWVNELAYEHPQVRNSLLAALANVSPEALWDQRLRKDKE